jgi:cold-inducible RNA-binding protein
MKLYVGNLSFHTTIDDLQAAFEPFGAVADVALISDRVTGRSRGFAFVTMGTGPKARRPSRACKAANSTADP